MRTIPFERPPAYVTLGEALRLAARYWRSTWDRWLLAVIAVALASGLADWLLGGTGVDQQTMTRVLLPVAGSRIEPSELPRLVAGPLAVGLTSLVAGWFLVANALAGLRDKEVTLPWVLGAGLRALAATLFLAMALTSVLLIGLGLGLVGLILLLGMMPVLVYVAIRLQFWTLSIFDGATVGQGAARSWRLTRDAVLRALGWGLAVFGIGALLAVVQFGIGFALAGVPAAGEAINSAIDTALQAFTIVVMAILYESQRGRNQPPAMVYPPAPYDPQGPYPPPPPQG